MHYLLWLLENNDSFLGFVLVVGTSPIFWTVSGICQLVSPTLSADAIRRIAAVDRNQQWYTQQLHRLNVVAVTENRPACEITIFQSREIVMAVTKVSLQS
jgi:hypothetical protein